MLSRILKPVLSVVVSVLFINVYAQVSAVKFTVHAPETNNKDIYIAGSFNYWHVADSLYKMKKSGDNVYTITLPLFKDKQYQYKYTLGNWDKVEIAMNDSDIHNRSFYSSKRKKITDTVVKWRQPKVAEKPVISAQMQKINSMKDSVLAKLQPELNNMLLLLKSYIENLLQPNPSVEVHQQLDKQAMDKVGAAYQQLSTLFWKVFGSLSAEQKQKILTAINQPRAKTDFINALSGALNDATKEKTPAK